MTTRRGNGEGGNPRLRADGRWTTEVGYTDTAGQYHRHPVYGKTAKECREARDAFRESLKDGPPAANQKMTVGDFAQVWLSATLPSLPLAIHSVEQKESMVRNHVLPTPLAGVQLGRLKGHHVEAWLVELRTGHKLAPASVRVAYICLCAILDVAKRDGALIGDNPARKIAPPQAPTEEAAHLEPAEVLALLAIFRNGATDTPRHQGPMPGQSRLAPMFELMVLTGIRIGEALGLRWSDINLDAGWFVVRKSAGRSRRDGLALGDTKTRKSTRPVGFADSPAVAAIFREMHSRQLRERLAAGTKWLDSGLVFTTAFGGPVEPFAAYRAFCKARDLAGLPKEVTPHTLRHTAASIMLTNNVPLTTVSRVLGHARESTTSDLYGHVSPAVANAALGAIAAVLAVPS